METLEWTTIDKSDWPEGPWTHEPDKVQWKDEATGMPCLIVRNAGGALCGYVGVAEGHPWHGLEYGAVISSCPHTIDPDAYRCWECQTIDGIIDAHGGLTYSDACQPDGDEATGICHIPAAGEPDHVWWFGFDCAHYLDVSPGREAEDRRRGWPPLDYDAVYRDVRYVKGQVSSLAAQLAAIPT